MDNFCCAVDFMASGDDHILYVGRIYSSVTCYCSRCNVNQNNTGKTTNLTLTSL